MRLSNIYNHALQNSDHLAVVNDGEEYSYRRFAGMIEAARQYIAAQNLPQGGVVAVFGLKLVYDWVLQFAARSLGHTTVTAASWKVLDQLRLSDLTAIISFDTVFAAWDGDPAARRGCLGVRVPIALMHRWDEFRLPEGPTENIPGDHIMFTSGTTGTYKKVRFDDSKFDDRERRLNAMGLGYGTHEVAHLGSFGTWTAAAWLSAPRAWSAGATVVFDQRQNWFEHFFDHPITFAYLFGPALALVADRAPPQPEHYPRFQARLAGGFPDMAALQKLQERFACWPVCVYGGTEFSAALQGEVRSAEDVLWLEPSLGGSFEIVDDDDRPVAVGTEGTVRIRLHPTEPQSYYDEPEATAQHYRGGYFYPGDMALQREDGRVRIVGRTADVLVIAGEKVAVRPHEERIEAALDVASVQLFSRQKDDGDRVLLVAIEAAELPAKARLQEALKPYASAFDSVRFFGMTAFPRGTNGMGKIDRRSLVQLIEK